MASRFRHADRRPHATAPERYPDEPSTLGQTASRQTPRRARRDRPAGGRPRPAQEPAKTPAPSDPPAAEAKKAGDPPAVDPDAPRIVGDLTARYRLQERYTNRAERAPAGATGQYQVAFRETTSVDDPQGEGTPDRAGHLQREARRGLARGRALVTDCIRHYNSVTITPDPWKNRTDRRPLEDLTLWCRDVTGEVPLVMVLTPDRPLREEEYKFAINYDFVTDLAFLLPEQARAWRDLEGRQEGAEALINDRVREGLSWASWSRFGRTRRTPRSSTPSSTSRATW